MAEIERKVPRLGNGVTQKTKPKGAISPDSKWSWLVVAGNLVIGVLTLGYFRCLSVFFRPLMFEFEVQYGSVALIPGMYCFGVAIGSFSLAHLTKRFGNRKTCFAAALVMCVCSIISSQSTNLIIIQLFFGFFPGFCTGLLFFTSVVTSSQYILKYRSLATSISTIGVPLGALALPPILDQLILHFGWRGAMIISSGIFLQGCISASLYLPVVLPDLHAKSNGIALQDKYEAKENEEKLLDNELKISEQDCFELEGSYTHQSGGDHATAARGASCRKSDCDTREKKSCWRVAKNRITDVLDLSLFRSPSLVFAMLTSVLYFSGYVSANTFLIPYGLERMNLGSLQATFILTGASGAECVAKVVYGLLGDIKCISRPLLLCLMSVLCTILIITVPKCETFSALLGVAIIYGFVGSAYHGVMPVVFCDIVGPRRLTTAIGYQGFLYNCLLAPCLYLLGYIVDKTGDIRIPFFICSGLLFLSAICLITIYILQRRKHRIIS